ncbi:MAG: hypothetical protein AAF936_03905 [Pseudomonadota bacterium]
MLTGKELLTPTLKTRDFVAACDGEVTIDDVRNWQKRFVLNIPGVDCPSPHDNRAQPQTLWPPIMIQFALYLARANKGSILRDWEHSPSSDEAVAPNLVQLSEVYGSILERSGERLLAEEAKQKGQMTISFWQGEVVSRAIEETIPSEFFDPALDGHIIFPVNPAGKILGSMAKVIGGKQLEELLAKNRISLMFEHRMPVSIQLKSTIEDGFKGYKRVMGQ